MTDANWLRDKALSAEERLVIQSYQYDTAGLCNWLWPEYFWRSFNSLHAQMFKAIDARNGDWTPYHQRVAIVAPRGIGKSTIARAKAAQSILYGQHRCIMWLSTSGSSAEEQTENLKRMLAEPLVISRFFDVKIDTKSLISERFGKEAWVAHTPYGDVEVIPRGSGQQVRGHSFGRYRPSLIICDDLEDAETIGNELIRSRRKQWFNADVLKLPDVPARNWQIIYIDTLKHEDALLAELLDSSDWATLRLPICTQDYKSLAPEHMSDEEVLHQVEMHRQNGTLDVFGREFMCEPVARESATFRPEYFKYYDETTEDLSARPGLESVVLVDVATTVSAGSAQSAVVGWSIDTSRGALYVRDIVAGRLMPDDLYEEALNMAIRLSATAIGIEVTGPNLYITVPFRAYMTRKGYDIELVEIRATAGSGEYSGKGRGKPGRIEALLPFYRKGLIWHNKTCCGPLESQLLSYPRSKYKDVMDAAAHIVPMIGKGGRFFLPQQIVVDKAEIPDYNTIGGDAGLFELGNDLPPFASRFLA